MTSEIWLAVISALLSIIGVLGILAYKDFARRMSKLEQQDAKIFAAVMTLLITKPDDHTAIANALHSLLTNGVTHD